ncbi:hypothetical protein M8C21_013091 [Ambrosia artemisiifolia]|uniref:Uncharacterized protein n=1 Tax=Ambrosia artemisiifolia TaxID=4212 RepID=A0AAD5DCZ1_AMBAR|nr:hypothetical protein M8C21_013091 [Ambrosia artemisiifolia]
MFLKSAFVRNSVGILPQLSALTEAPFKVAACIFFGGGLSGEGGY